MSTVGVLPPRPSRPRVVFAAAYLLAGSAAFWFASAVATLFALPEYDRHHSDLAQDPTAGTGAVLLLVLFATGAFGAAGLALLLAFLDAQGRPAARVLTWILGGFSVCVAGSLLLVDPFTATGWHHALMLGASVLTLVLVGAVVVLLALRSSGGYYRAVRMARQAAARLAYAARYGPAPAYPGWTVYNPPPGPVVMGQRAPSVPPPPPPPPLPPREGGWGRPG